ncbi:autophagy-related protein 23-like [Nicotiana sylvestris]|uniref:Uncharacterized protein LOC104245968 n=1 Tax=Nicotiana sylvestris TaxID=4096 RepID=A0A1U7YA60_NICSY|nr:PREDICTED: uncharacterized protein LOC104245968 [Nicotiana sylvestris]
MSPAPPGEEEAPKPSKDKKRKRVSISETSKPKKSKTHKPKNDVAVLSEDAFLWLRDEEEEEHEDGDFRLVARNKSAKAIEPAMIEEVQPRVEEGLEDASSRVPKSAGADVASHRDAQSVDVSERASSEALRKGESAPSDLLGAINIDSSSDAAVMLHREAFNKSQAQINRYGAALKMLTDERDDLKCLYVQMVEEIKDLQAELATSHKKQTDLIEQVQQKAEKIEQLREEAEIKDVETLEWKQNMDRLASEKDTARDQLSAVERHLQSVKKESLARDKKIKDLEARLAAELAKTASVAERAKADA